MNLRGKLIGSLFVWSMMPFGLMVGMPSMETVATSDHVGISPVVQPSHAELLQQKKLQDQRSFHRRVLTTAVAGGSCALLYGACAFRKAHEQHKAQTMVVVPRDSMVRPATVCLNAEHSWLVQGYHNISKGMINMGWDMTRFLADAVSMLAAGLVANSIYEQVKHQLVESYQQETLLWFLENHTQITQIFADLKQCAITHDPHSVLLHQPQAGQDAVSAQLKALLHVLAYQEDSPELGQFARRRLHQLQSQQQQATDECAALQNCRAPHAAEFARSMQHNMYGLDRHKQVQSLHNVALLCNVLSGEIQKMLAFIAIHRHRCPLRIQDLIASANQYLQQMEQMLSLSEGQREELSRQQQGMFTLTYEYERMLKQQITFLHKYCKIVELS